MLFPNPNPNHPPWPKLIKDWASCQPLSWISSKGSIKLNNLISLYGSKNIAIAIAIFLEPYRLIRLLSFIDPFEDIQDSGWQLAQSLISLGQGGWFGLGLGNSIQKNLFLPEAHTDFIFAILIEELGIIGGVCLILIYVFLLISIFKVSFESFNKIRPFQGYLCFGIGFLISLQVILNIGVNIGLLPTKGLTLPFISYGGTSLLVMMSLIAIVVRINNENKFYKWKI